MHSNDGARNVWAKGVIATALGVWLAVVVLTTSKHEFWRDEVRALTLARAAESPLDLYGLVQYQGHPVLWYLLLYLGTSIADTPRVLPITSVVIAFAAVALFMIAAPFPLWFRCAFIFGALPLYEYSVMARNYGISMLLLFVAAVLYRKRGQHPIRLALVLALLANTNVHSAGLVGMIAGVWIFEELIGSASLHGTRSFGRPVVQSFGRSVVRVASPKPRIGEGGSLGLPDEVASNRGAETGRSDPLPGARHIRRKDGSSGLPRRSREASKAGGVRALVPALTIVAAGLLLCAVFATPRENTSLTFVRHSLEWRELGAAVVTSATKPHRIFPDLLAPDPSILSAPVFALATLGLIGRPPLFLAAAGAQVLFGTIFLVVYPGSYRHQGLYLVFLVFLYWLLAESAPWKGIPLRRQLFVAGFYGSIVVLVAADVVKVRHSVWADIHSEKSASRRLGKFLRSSDRFRDAILVPEPDFAIEALPYYADNRIYLAREQRFGRTVSWTTEPDAHLTLGELLAAAQQVKRESDAPVLVLLGTRHLVPEGGEQRYMYRKVLVWTAEDVALFRKSTELVALFDVPYGDERFAVYVLK